VVLYRVFTSLPSFNGTYTMMNILAHVGLTLLLVFVVAVVALGGKYE
jgi:hypothetical protein